jgi:tetratricopeptide (TPR) repeat protein
MTLERLGRGEEARNCYRSILAADAGYLPSALALARNCRDSGDVDGAIEVYEQVLSINPRHRDTLFELALLMIHGQRYEYAEMLLEKLLKWSPEDGPALMNYGVVLTRLDRPQRALAAYDRLIALGSAPAAVRVNRAAVLAYLDRLKEAEAEYRLVLKAEPGNRAAAVGLHEVLQQTGRYHELVALWESLAGRHDADDEVRGWLAWAYVLAGETDRAGEVIRSMDRSADVRRFAVWALAFDALRLGYGEAFRRMLGEPRLLESVSAKQREQGRIVLMALSSLPEDVRRSSAGQYALARALLFGGDEAGAANAAITLSLRHMEGGEWDEAAADLLDALKRSEDSDISRDR